jgi:hypothetical protein
MVEPSRRTTIYATLHQSGLYGRVARWKPLLSKRHITARFSGLMKPRLNVWRKPGIIPTVKHAGGSIMLWG